MSDIENLLKKISDELRPDFLVAELAVDGLDLGPVLKVSGEEALSKQFRYEVTVELDGPPPDLSSIVGAAARLVVRDAKGNDRIIVGIVADILARSYDSDTHRAEIVIRPKIYRQNLGRDCYAMQEVSSIDVIRDVLADFPGKIRYDLARQYPTYPYRAQYREDDWTYVSRLCEEEGIYYWFDHEGDDSTVVFADTSSAAPEIEGIPLIQFASPSSMRPGDEAVIEMSMEATMTAKRFAGRSFDPDRPLLSIEAKDGDGGREDYDAPGAGPVEPAVLEFRIKNAREAAMAARSGVGGVALSARLTPGRIFVLAGHPYLPFNGEFLVTGMTLEATQKVPAVARFKAIPRDVPFRPQCITPLAKQAGLQMAQVVGPPGQEVFTDPRGRVRAQLHWDRVGDRRDRAGTWMRIDQRGAPGSMMYPRMGWNVATFNDEGGVDAPAILSRIHDQDHPPEYELPKNMTLVVWKTATTPGGGSHNEIRFEDAAGRQEMFINASRDMNQLTREKRTERVKGNHTLTVKNDMQRSIDDNGTMKVSKDQTIKVDGNEDLEVVNDLAVIVGGDHSREVGGNEALTVGQSTVVRVVGNRKLTVTGSMTEVCKGDIQLNVEKKSTVTVNGSLERIAGETLSDTVAKKYVQKIDADKVEICNEGERSTTVGKSFTETVKGSIKIDTQDEFIDNADTTQEIVVKKTMSGEAPMVWVEAVNSVRIRCGSSVITVTKTGITFEGTDLDLSGASVDADTARIQHN